MNKKTEMLKSDFEFSKKNCITYSPELDVFSKDEYTVSVLDIKPLISRKKISQLDADAYIPVEIFFEEEEE